MGLSGVMAPVLTPFDANLAPDPARFLRHCRELLRSGCSALAIFGTTSEANSLSVEERERLIRRRRAIDRILRLRTVAPVSSAHALRVARRKARP